MSKPEYQSEQYAHSLGSDQFLFKKILKLLNPRPEDKILEIGCNRGSFVKQIQGISPHTYGIDVNKDAIAHGETRDLQVMDATSMTFEDNTFDKIYSSHMIEHIPGLTSAFREMERVLRPGGRIVLVYPAEPIRGIFAIRSAWVMFKNPFRARDIHVNKLDPKKIQELININGIKLDHVESQFFPLKIPQYFTVLQKRLSS